MPKRQKMREKSTKSKRQEAFAMLLFLTISLSVLGAFLLEVKGDLGGGFACLFLAAIFALLLIAGMFPKEIRTFAEFVRAIVRRPSRVRVETLEQLKSLSPQEFERAMATLLEDMGYRKVRVTGGIGDLSRDIICENLTRQSVTVQCKRYSDQKISSPEIQKFLGMKTVEHKAEKGIFITTSSFTEPAKELAKKHDIVLWDGNKLADLLIKQSKARV